MTNVRELTTEAEWREAYPVFEQLRPEFSEADYLRFMREERPDAHHLFARFDGDDIVALAGVGVQVNVYYGRHVWVYSLVTDEAHRSKGYGHELLSWVEEWATEQGCEKIALSSHVRREDAHRFYEETAGYDQPSYVFTKEL